MKYFSYIIIIVLISIKSSFLPHIVAATLTSTSTPYDRLGSGAMFTSISAYYDIINSIFTFSLDSSWRTLLLDTTIPLSTSNPVRYLDLATGTCEVIKEYLNSEREPPKTILGVDPSEGMLNVGHAKVRAEAAANAPSISI